MISPTRHMMSDVDFALIAMTNVGRSLLTALPLPAIMVLKGDADRKRVVKE